jgi:hypothetical protein
MPMKTEPQPIPPPIPPQPEQPDDDEGWELPVVMTTPRRGLAIHDAERIAAEIEGRPALS